ncbi:MAG TPA: SMI1/KNR4 family protein [Gemmataceae bacterium]|nr:SMI1/KNR4 family protein [Gemmataceae bacterium]
MNEIDTTMRNLSHDVRDSCPGGQKLLPAEEELLSQFEQEIGHRLPPDYRYFLSRYSGVRLFNAMIHPAVQDEKLESVEGIHLISFFGFYTLSPQGGKCSSDLSWNYRVYKDFLPAGVIPIAEFCGDYLFCISCAPETYGRIFVKVPEEFDDDDPADFLFPQAPSLLDFLRSLHTLTDEETHAWYKARGGT